MQTYAQSLGSGRVEDELGLDEVREVLQRLGLAISYTMRLCPSVSPAGRKKMAYILENGLHQTDGSLGLLDKLVLGLLHVQAVASALFSARQRRHVHVE